MSIVDDEELARIPDQSGGDFRNSSLRTRTEKVSQIRFLYRPKCRKLLYTKAKAKRCRIFVLYFFHSEPYTRRLAPQ